MILRSLVLMAGLAGAFGAAQFPAYSQQYLQRLGGAVDALEQVVSDFDASAVAVGLNREEALAQMTGSAFVQARRSDMERTFRRYDSLQSDLELLKSYGPFMRAYHASHLTDREIARGAWQAFEPSLPMSFAGLFFAAFGFLFTVTVAGCACVLFRPRAGKPALSA